MQKWEEVEDLDALRETAAKLGVANPDTMDREQLIEALNTAEVSEGSSGAQGQSIAEADAESAFGHEDPSS